MPTKHHQLKVTLNPDERARVDALAGQMRVSRAELLRRLVLGQRLPDPSDFVAWESVRDLMRVNADLARLGNLFKMALAEAPETELAGELERLAPRIAETQEAVKAAARAIHDDVKGRRRRA